MYKRLNDHLHKIVVVVLAASLSACAGVQIHRSTSHHSLTLTDDKLRNHCIAFLTPATPTGQEEDKQALVLGFVDVLHELRNGVCVVPLSETLSAINAHDLSNEYLEMYRDYKQTGLFKRELLKQISDITDARYLVQLNLAGFRQRSSGRFSLLGIRMIETKIGNIRLFVQVWDGQTGTIAWEGTQELNYADDTFAERPITFQLVVEEAAKDLVKRMPRIGKKKDLHPAADNADAVKENVESEYD